MKTFKNIMFGLSGGWFTAVYFIVTAIGYALSVVGIKKAYALFKCAAFCFAPFGKNVYTDFTSHKIGNTFWAFTTGWQPALLCVLFASFWYITIVGRFLGARYFQLAQYAVSPFGAKCYPTALLTGGESAVAKLRAEHNFEL